MAVSSPEGVGEPGTPFVFPPSYEFPPFFTLQPNAGTRRAQLGKWSSLIQAYYRHHHLYRLSLVDAAESPLFHNYKLNRHLSLSDVRIVIEWMCGKEAGERAEWAGREKEVAWVYWRRPEEWAGLIAEWVDETAQKNTVLTLYELTEGEMTLGQDFHGLDQEILHKSLNVLVKRGRAQVFGTEEQQGVKFF